MTKSATRVAADKVTFTQAEVTSAVALKAPIASPSFTGDATVSTGNLVIGTNGKGIDFSANADSSATGASTTSELLDDYEEGTWTGAASGVTATVQNTKYTKIGRLVYVTGHIICTANATADVSISGLPFAIAGSENGIGTAMNYNVNIAGGSTYNFVTYVQGSSIRFYRSEDNSPWLWAGSGTLNNGSQILFNVTYQAA